MYGPPLRTLLVSIACKRLEFLLSAVPPELGRTLVRTTAQRRERLPVRQSLDAPPRACDEWRGQRYHSSVRLCRRAQLKGLVSWRKRMRGACQCSDFAADAPLWASNSLDGFDRLLPQPAPLPTNPTVARCRCGVGPCLAQRRDLHSVLQLEPFELRPIGGSTPSAIFSTAWHLPFHDRVGYHVVRIGSSAIGTSSQAIRPHPSGVKRSSQLLHVPDGS